MICLQPDYRILQISYLPCFHADYLTFRSTTGKLSFMHVYRPSGVLPLVVIVLLNTSLGVEAMMSLAVVLIASVGM